MLDKFHLPTAIYRMGLRGPLPKTRTPAQPLTRQDAPDWLGKDAAEYWNRHSAGLTANGILTAATEDSFALLCDLWQRVREMEGSPTTRSYLDTVKSFTSLAKQFRLLPTEPPKENPARHSDKPEFEF